MHKFIRSSTVVFAILFANIALADDIKIAAQVPATGQLTRFGENIIEGVKTAVEQTNAHG